VTSVTPRSAPPRDTAKSGDVLATFMHWSTEVIARRSRAIERNLERFLLESMQIEHEGKIQCLRRPTRL
jgi:hypothetical protein